MEKEILSKLRSGMRIRVWQKIPTLSVSLGEKSRKGGKEDEKERVQQFEGIILARKHGKEIGATITVRAVVAGVGVEKIYPLHSPTIKKIEILQEPAKYRRAKLYYLRKTSARRTREKIGAAS